MTHAYRDDEGPLRERIEQLNREQETLRARTRELRDVEAREAEIARELEETHKRLDDLRGPAMELERLRIASPCKASWEAMQGDDRVRFCGQCQKNVYNLAGMRRDEATALVKDRTGEVCVRMYRREDGTVLTADCPVGSKKKNVRRLAVLAAGGGALALAGAGLWARMSEPRERFVAGSIEALPTTAEPVATFTMGAAPAPEPSAMGSVSLPVSDPPHHPRMGKPMAVDHGPVAPTGSSDGTKGAGAGHKPR